jgi:acetyl-CoA C-acetyltransferase
MSMSDDVVIVSAARTPVGSFNGAFATMPAHDLGAFAIKAALERAGIEPGRVSEVIMGQILTAARPEPGPPGLDRRRHPGGKPGLGASISSAAAACALWRWATRRCSTAIPKSSVAGGQESMSMAPHAQYLRGGTKMGRSNSSTP